MINNNNNDNIIYIYNATKVLPARSRHGKPILDNKKQWFLHAQLKPLCLSPDSLYHYFNSSKCSKNALAKTKIYIDLHKSCGNAAMKLLFNVVLGVEIVGC